MKAHQNRNIGNSVFTEQDWMRLASRLHLSSRSLQIVRHVFDDSCEKEMSSNLGISRRTVHTHLERVYKRFGVHSRASLIVFVVSEYMESNGRSGHTEAGGRP
ncbi:MAG: LuxR family transcriptional regulator [Acidimicrobiia bacterium]|nr:LuxR family transcriptional regulator [Acidimicrobiia bacterium]